MALLRFESVSKTWPNGTVALREASFAIEQGTIHAIVGENGAGKSTLMKVLAGLEPATAGRIGFDGPRPRIGMVHQHFSLVPSLTVAENVVLGREPVRRGLVDFRAARVEVARLADRFGLPVDPDARVDDLSVAARQKVEILKALAGRTELLILDEPTAVLAPPEVEGLFERLLALRDAGLTLLFISHKLHEVRRLADSVTVLRLGRIEGTFDIANVNDAQLVRLMMGQLPPSPSRARRALGRPVLAFQGASLDSSDPAGRVSGLDLIVSEGEILGIAGVEGSGSQGLVRLATGQARPSAGQVLLQGKDMAGRPRSAWRRAGLAHLPADRFAEGGAPSLSVLDNLIAGTAALHEVIAGPFLRRAAARAWGEARVREFDVRVGDGQVRALDRMLGSLSGGNAQKLIAARELSSLSRLVVADQPTRGIDMAAAMFLRERLRAAAEGGAAVLLLSSDLDEVVDLSHRVLVLFAGHPVALLENDGRLTAEILGRHMVGLGTGLANPIVSPANKEAVT